MIILKLPTLKFERNNIFIDHIVDTTNFLISWLTYDAIDCLMRKILHNFVGRNRGRGDAVRCPWGFCGVGGVVRVRSAGIVTRQVFLKDVFSKLMGYAN